ncbi:hypothetical protein Avbf_14391 [Armadillidium vulgare]|nr:hypothetical protein Avbf_14391 [Armadillidium vulgare]
MSSYSLEYRFLCSVGSFSIRTTRLRVQLKNKLWQSEKQNLNMVTKYFVVFRRLKESKLGLNKTEEMRCCSFKYRFLLSVGGSFNFRTSKFLSSIFTFLFTLKLFWADFIPSVKLVLPKKSGGKKIGIDIPKTWGTIVAFCILCIVFSKNTSKKSCRTIFPSLVAEIQYEICCISEVEILWRLLQAPKKFFRDLLEFEYKECLLNLI